MSNKRTNTLKEILEQEIVTGQLAPGERLEETKLATRFGVSRTPVREALNKLAFIGLVQMRPHRGAVVATIGIKDMIEMFEVMAELEGACGWLAAMRMYKDDHISFLACHKEARPFVDNQDLIGYYDYNLRFHECIYKGSRNHFLADQTRSLSKRLAPYRRLQLNRHKRLSESFEEHGGILDTIIQGDGEMARKLLREHVIIQGGSFTDFIATLPSNMIHTDSK